MVLCWWKSAFHECYCWVKDGFCQAAEMFSHVSEVLPS